MNKIIMAIIILCLVVSVAINYITIAGEGIHTHTTYHQEQYNNQSQAQLLILTYAKQGFLVWNFITNKEIDNMGLGDGVEDKYCGYLESLAPEQALMAKIAKNGIFVPTIIEEKEEKKAGNQPKERRK